MTGRIPFGVLTLLTVLVCLPIQAQDPMGPPPGYGASQAGYQQYQLPQGQNGQYYGLPLTYQPTPVMGPQATPPRKVFEELPDDLGFTDTDTPLGNILKQAFRHSWFRGEYLLWNISGPGNTLLGEQTLSGVPGGTPFTAVGATATGTVNINGNSPNSAILQGTTFSRTVNGISGTAQSPFISDFSLTNLNGFRGTYGIPVPVGQIELSAFVLAPIANAIDYGVNIPGGLIQRQIIANPAVTQGSLVGVDGNPATNGQTAAFVSQATLLNGARSDKTFIDYDVSYHAKLTTSAWGSEVNYVMDSPDPNTPFQLRPTFGVRYFNFQDRLDQNGQYNQANALNPLTSTVVTRQINSAAQNNLAGPQIGMRAEFVQSQFLVGFEPKLLMGLNAWQTNLDTANVFSATDPAQSLVAHGTTFSPMVDLKCYSNVSLSKYLSAYVSYNFLYVGNVTRSYNDIVYNKNGLTNQSDFSIQKTYSTATLQGLSFGFEFRY